MKIEKECQERCSPSIDQTFLGHPYPLHLGDFNIHEQSSLSSMVFDPSQQALAPLPSSFHFPSLGHEIGEYCYHQSPSDPNYQLGGDTFYLESHELYPLSFHPKLTEMELVGLDKSMLTSHESFSHLPNLESAEQLQYHQMISPASPSIQLKRRRVGDGPLPQPLHITDSLVRSSFIVSQSKHSSEASPCTLSARSDFARMQRQKIGDKTRSLQKLMPWDKKMDMATLLEEAFKYVKFLQAQVEALHWMPLESSFAGGGHTGCSAFGLLMMLNRQQLLQVLVNSHTAQTTLYSQGLCVFSYEQLLLFDRMNQSKTGVLKQSLTESVSENGGE